MDRVGYLADPDHPDYERALVRSRRAPALSRLPSSVDPDLEPVYTLTDAEEAMVAGTDVRLAAPAGVIDTLEDAARALSERAEDQPADAAADPGDPRDVAREAVRTAFHAPDDDAPGAVVWLRDATRTQMAWRLEVLTDEYDDPERGINHAYATEMLDAAESIQGTIAKMYHDAVVQLLTERTVVWMDDTGDGD